MIEKSKFSALLQEVSIYEESDFYDLFSIYCQELQEWNEKVNLTAITDDENIAMKHFIDSILPLTLVDIPTNATMIDVGTGAGFPSIPMKIVRKDIDLTLLDSLEKRLVFLRHICSEMKLENNTIHRRAEEAGKQKDLRENYDIAISRAVASMALLAEYCLPLVKVGGMMIALKGSSGLDEVELGKNAIELCGGVIEKVTEYKLPNKDPRTLVIIRKVSPTPVTYPRNSARIAKKSL